MTVFFYLWYTNPNLLLQVSNWSLGTALVKMSAAISLVEQYSNKTSLEAICSLTKWNWTSMCFVRRWCTRLFNKAKLPWLLLSMRVAFFCMYPTSPKNLLSHKTSFVAWVHAMYSTSVEERAIVDCFLLAQETGAPPKRKT